MVSLPTGLRDWAELAGPAALLAEARARLESGRFGPASRLGAGLSAAERAQVGRLLGVRWEVSGQAVTGARLERAVAAYGVTCRELVAGLSGPLRDLPGERSARDADRRQDAMAAQAIFAGLVGRPAGAAPPSPDEVVAVAVQRCLPPAGQGRATDRAAALARIWAHLPPEADPPIQLPVLAVRTIGDAHALDRDRALGRAAAWLAALTAAAAASAATATYGDPPAVADPTGSAAAWRDAWAGVGVSCDDVSSLVLVHNLPLVAPPAAAAVSVAAAGQPWWLTARMLRDGPAAPGPGVQPAYVCENPSVVEAAADRWGAASAPLICLYGVPSRAATLLLDGLVAHGVRLHVRADGDATGEQIVGRLLARFPSAVRWRPAPGRYEEELIDDLVTDLHRDDHAVDG